MHFKAILDVFKYLIMMLIVVNIKIERKEERKKE